MTKAIDKKIDLAIGHISEAASGLENLQDDMQEDFDEKSEAWQESSAGEVMKEHIDLLEDIVARLGDMETELSDLKSTED